MTEDLTKNQDLIPQVLSKAKICRTEVFEIINLRHEALRRGHPIEEVQFEEDKDELSRHYAVFYQDSCIACVSFIDTQWQQQSAWRLRAMAVEEQYRGIGVGKALLKFALKDLIDNNLFKTIWCYSRVSSESFYSSFGFTSIGEHFTYGNAGESIEMVLQKVARSIYEN